jgi:hypothetical protein
MASVEWSRGVWAGGRLGIATARNAAEIRLPQHLPSAAMSAVRDAGAMTRSSAHQVILEKGVST